MLQVQRAVLRPRLRRTWLAACLALGVAGVGIATGLALAVSHHPTGNQGWVDRVERARLEVRALSLEVCLARVEVGAMRLREACAAGTAPGKDCSQAEGQYRVDPCARYRPRAQVDACPFPGSC